MIVLGPEKAAIRKQNVRGLKQTTPLHLGLKVKTDRSCTSIRYFCALVLH